MSFVLPALYPILDEHYFPRDLGERAAFLTRTVAELRDAGVTILQLRMKTASRDELLRDGAVVRKAAAGMQLILNDHAALVAATRFDGVHLGQGDLRLEAARGQVGADIILGLSTHTADEAADGDGTTADYLATGPVFATGSKTDAAAPIGLDGVRAARRNTGKPLVAIGGITLETAAAVRDAGADSLAVIGAIFGSSRSPGRLAEDFLRLFR